MKITATEKFLWHLCDKLNIAGNLLDVLLFSPPRIMGQASATIDELFLCNKRYYKNKTRLSKSIYYLETKGYIKTKSIKGGRAVVLTKNGIEKMLRASFKLEGKSKRKDGKWIMLAFDMPANHKKSRDLLRSILYNLGYKIFQQSVWITPYDVYDKTEKLLRYHSLEKYVKIFLIEEMN